MSVSANLSKGITKIKLLYKEKRVMHDHIKFQNVKNRLERSKIQHKCLIKICEKIINGFKGPFYGYQTDNEDSLSDTNKSKEDQEKWGLNRKDKTLKRSWFYRKESSQILEPSAKSKKILPKVRKTTTKFKSKKEEIWKEEA